MGRRKKEAAQIEIYEICVSPEAQRGLFSVTRNNRRIIVAAIDELATNPRPSNSKLLVKAENLRRLTVGDYRIIYGIEQGARKVTIELVRHRSIVYTLLAAVVLGIRAKRYSR